MSWEVAGYRPLSKADMLVSSSSVMACKASTPGSAFPCSIAEICWRENPVCAASSVMLSPLLSLSFLTRKPILTNRALPPMSYMIGSGAICLRKVYLTDIKAEIYNALAGLNRGFDMALESLAILWQEGVVTTDYVQQQTEAIELLRAGINSLILGKLEAREIEDREHYGKMHTATEAQLRNVATLSEVSTGRL